MERMYELILSYVIKDDVGGLMRLYLTFWATEYSVPILHAINSLTEN